MFNQRILRIEAFPTSLRDAVCVRNNGLDESLFMTATILLYNRVDKLRITYSVENGTDIDNGVSLNPEVFSFHYFETKSDPDDLMEKIKKDVKTIEKLPTHEKFLSEQLKQPVHIRLLPNENTVCIFTSRVTFPVWHATQFFIPKYFKLFKEKPLAKDEISFLETLTHKMPQNYIKSLAELTNKASFKAYVLKDQLSAFEKKLFEKKVEAARNSLEKFERDMEEALRVYGIACEKRVEAIALVNGLETMANNTKDHTELQDYLINNPRLCCVRLNGTNISFIVKTYLAPHHIEEWDVMSKHNQMFGQLVNGCIDNEADAKLLLDAIFSENRCLKLRMCAYFNMDYFGSNATSCIHYDYAGNDITLRDYIPNPHLYFHNCFDQNKRTILSQLACGDAIGAIECSIACAQRVNIHESITFNPFVRMIFNSTGKCLVAEDGTELTPAEAVKYLKGQKHE